MCGDISTIGIRIRGLFYFLALFYFILGTKQVFRPMNYNFVNLQTWCKLGSLVVSLLKREIDVWQSSSSWDSQ